MMDVVFGYHRTMDYVFIVTDFVVYAGLSRPIYLIDCNDPTNYLLWTIQQICRNEGTESDVVSIAK